jgi:hypothetical protein
MITTVVVVVVVCLERVFGFRAEPPKYRPLHTLRDVFNVFSFYPVTLLLLLLFVVVVVNGCHLLYRWRQCFY